MTVRAPLESSMQVLDVRLQSTPQVSKKIMLSRTSKHRTIVYQMIFEFCELQHSQKGMIRVLARLFDAPSLGSQTRHTLPSSDKPL